MDTRESITTSFNSDSVVAVPVSLAFASVLLFYPNAVTRASRFVIECPFHRTVVG